VTVRITGLIGSKVYDRSGRGMGEVHDVRLAQDGPPIGSFGAALRVESLLFGASAIGVRLGFARRDVRAPWPIKTAFRTVHGRMRAAGWQDVAAIEERRVRLRAPANRLAPGPAAGRTAARVLDAGLELLDRQLIDVNGLLAGNVDDLELTFPEEGHGPPIVSAILSGPGALSRRIGGKLGGWLADVHERLQDCDLEGPANISFGVVAHIDTDVRQTISREHLGSMRFADWARHTIIEKIPGS
jgi:hypothetical protein